MSSQSATEKKVTVRDFAAARERGDKLVVVSTYDTLFARLSDEGGVDAVLVGDSLGNVIAGYDSPIPVTLNQMIYHAGCVRRGLRRAMLIVDMPFLTYQVSVEDALRNCGRVVQETGAAAVKIEGASEPVLQAVRALAEVGVPVMGHLGLTPQHLLAFGGFRVQGREAAAAQRLLDDARRLQDAGAFSLVLELMPSELATRITDALSIPTIGIGAGPGCSGQVLVLHDLLGLNDGFKPRFLKRYAELGGEARSAIRAFGDEVRAGQYPASEHEF